MERSKAMKPTAQELRDAYAEQRAEAMCNDVRNFPSFEVWVARKIELSPMKLFSVKRKA